MGAPVGKLGYAGPRPVPPTPPMPPPAVSWPALAAICPDSPGALALAPFCAGATSLTKICPWRVLLLVVAETVTRPPVVPVGTKVAAASGVGGVVPMVPMSVRSTLHDTGAGVPLRVAAKVRVGVIAPGATVIVCSPVGVMA